MFSVRDSADTPSDAAGVVFGPSPSVKLDASAPYGP